MRRNGQGCLVQLIFGMCGLPTFTPGGPSFYQNGSKQKKNILQQNLQKKNKKKTIPNCLLFRFNLLRPYDSYTWCALFLCVLLLTVLLPVILKPVQLVSSLPYKTILYGIFDQIIQNNFLHASKSDTFALLFIF